MYFVVFATHNQESDQERLSLSDSFGTYLRDATGHPSVTVHHSGPTLSESGDTVTGLLQVLEAPSRDAARAFVADSPYGRAGIFAECHIRAWNWLIGCPG